MKRKEEKRFKSVDEEEEEAAACGGNGGPLWPIFMSVDGRSNQCRKPTRSVDDPGEITFPCEAASNKYVWERRCVQIEM